MDEIKAIVTNWQMGMDSTEAMRMIEKIIDEIQIPDSVDSGCAAISSVLRPPKGKQTGGEGY